MLEQFHMNLSQEGRRYELKSIPAQPHADTLSAGFRSMLKGGNELMKGRA
jgi:hypothetical protein